jgi:hypothetical protein
VSALAYLGPEGTFTHQAALDLAREGDELRPAATAVDVVRAVAAGAVAGGVVAFENSLEGSVAENLDEILRTPEVVLAGERALPVSFALLRAQGDDAPLRAVTSHPFALAQCARFLREHRIEAVEAASTAAAARELASAGPGIGALAPVTAAAVYGLRVEHLPHHLGGAGRRHGDEHELAAGEALEPVGDLEALGGGRLAHGGVGVVARAAQRAQQRAPDQPESDHPRLHASTCSSIRS